MACEGGTRALRPRAFLSAAGITTSFPDNVRHTRAVAKRSATDDANIAVLQPRKRAVQRNGTRGPLTDISNEANAASSACFAMDRINSNKGQVLECSKFFVKDENTHSHDSGQLRVMRSDPNVVRIELQEAALEFRPLDAELDSGPESENSSSALGSLEPRTARNHFLPNVPNAREKRDVLFDDDRFLEKSSWSSGLAYVDIDTDLSDPNMCSSYATDIYTHLRMAEIKRRPTTDFMEVVQKDINPSMRGILVDWLVDVAEEYMLMPDTLYLAVSYIDRFLSCNVVTRQRLQLLGVSCMLIAAKYEEICAPHVEQFCYITDHTYQREEVLEMERKVLRELKFELTTPTTKSFLRRFIRAAQANCKAPTPVLESLGNFLAELTLTEYSFLGFLPSMVAASAVYVAKLTLDPSTCPWDATLQHYTGYKASELEKCVRVIHDLQRNSKKCTLPAIREKYRDHKFECVATLTPPLVLTPEFFKDA